MSGAKIIRGLEDAVAGNFTSVTIAGQRWVRADTAGWQDISTAPKDGMSVDLWCRNISHGSTNQTRFSDMFVNADGKWEDWHGYILEPKWRPTHWKRLDAGPGAQL